MQLSVIIVNYNVKYFLEQCLHSVVKAIDGINAEILVIDNDSKDGSIAYLQPIFPRVKFIANNTNDGFAKANNKALALSNGDYVLFLNPDTIVPEDCFRNCINFFKEHNDCGALGVQMIDGSGKFLPESKRAFPSLGAAFFKLTGLSLIFPKSAVFNKYALGNLPTNESYEVDVLAGAFMMLSKPVTTATKGFDENYFMYGEDIDLSYKVQQAGYKNYYFGEQKIIHFKGESTKRGSLNYVRMFYNAMSIFVKKHYSGSKATIFSIIINIAIWCRALVTVFQNILNKTGMILIDALVVSSSLFITKYLWEIKITAGVKFTSTLAEYYIPSFTLVFLIGALLSGIYDNMYKPSKAFVSSISAVIIMLAVYSLMPENWRFSRGVILAGGILSGLMVTIVRWLFIQLNLIKDNEAAKFKPVVIVGSHLEQTQVLQLMQKSDIENKYLGRIGVKNNDTNTIGNIDNIDSLCKQINIGEIIFCEGNLSFKEIIEHVIKLKKQNLSFRFYSKKSHCVIGSDSKTSTGEAITADGNFSLSNPYQQRMKRMLDIWISLTIIATYPLQLLLFNNATKVFKSAWQVFFGKRTWVGYSSFQNTLPLIPTGYLTPNGYSNNGSFEVSITVLKKTDILYAKDYEWLQDLNIVYHNYKNIAK